MMFICLASFVICSLAQTSTVSTTITTTTPPLCVVSSWSEWAECLRPDCIGTEIRSRNIVVDGLNCPNTTQARCVRGNCFDEVYFEIDGKNFFLFAPLSGSLTFRENGSNWTFASVQQQAEDYADVQFAPISMSVTDQINTAIATTLDLSKTRNEMVNSTILFLLSNQTSTLTAVASTLLNTSVSTLSSTATDQSSMVSSAIAAFMMQSAPSIALQGATVSQQVGMFDSAISSSLSMQNSSISPAIDATSSMLAQALSQLGLSHQLLSQTNTSLSTTASSSALSLTTAVSSLNASQSQDVSSTLAAQSSNADVQYATLSTAVYLVSNNVSTLRTNLTTTQMLLATVSTTVASFPLDSIAASALSLNSSLFSGLQALQALTSTQQSRTTLLEGYTLDPRMANVETKIAAPLLPDVSTLVSQTLLARLQTLNSTLVATATSVNASNSRLNVLEASVACERADAGYRSSPINSVCIPRTIFQFQKWDKFLSTSMVTWQDASRNMLFYKALATTHIIITWMDNFGIDALANLNQCLFRISINGSPVGLPLVMLADTGTLPRNGPAFAEWIVTGLPVGWHRITAQMMASAATVTCTAAWSGISQETIFAKREIDAINSTFSMNFAQYVSSSTTWTTVTGRTISYSKRSAATDLWVSYNDNLGFLATGVADGVGFRLTVDGTPYLESRMYSGNSSLGWFEQPCSLMFFIPDLAAGSHTFAIQAIVYAGASQVTLGNPSANTLNNFIIEERTRGNIAYVSFMPYTTFTSSSYVAVSGRSVMHTKRFDHTVIRVTYVDTIGHNCISASGGSGWAVYVDGARPSNIRSFWTLCNSLNGWRVWPTRLMMIPQVSAGQHLYQIWANINTVGSNLGIAGYANALTYNILMVEEVEAPTSYQFT